MTDLPTHLIRFADLPTRKRTQFTIEPDAAGRRALADTLGVLSLRKVKLDGALIPTGKRDWRIEADLGATVQQACVVSLEPVTTRIDEPITRAYAAEFDHPTDDEIELDADDSADPLPATLDLVDVLAEALVLTMPAYPRKDGISAEVVGVTEPGKSVMTDEDARPFAGLAALRDSLENKDDDAK